MSLRNFASFQDALLALENALAIDYRADNQTVEETADAAIMQLEKVYQVPMAGRESVYELMKNNIEFEGPLQKLVFEVLGAIQKISFFTLIEISDRRHNQTLLDVYSLGNSKEKIVRATQYISYLTLMDPYGIGVVNDLATAASRTDLGEIRRLITCMLVLTKLGMLDVVTVIGNYLRQGVECQ